MATKKAKPGGSPESGDLPEEVIDALTEFATRLSARVSNFDLGFERQTMEKALNDLQKAEKKMATLNACAPGESWEPLLARTRLLVLDLRGTVDVLPATKIGLLHARIAELYVELLARRKLKPGLGNRSVSNDTMGKILGPVTSEALTPEAIRKMLKTALQALKAHARLPYLNELADRIEARAEAIRVGVEAKNRRAE